MEIAAKIPPISIRRLVTSALVWSTGSTALTQVLAFVRSIILARLLNPEAYGLFSMAVVVLQGLTVLTEFNFRELPVHGSGRHEGARQ